MGKSLTFQFIECAFYLSTFSARRSSKICLWPVKSYPLITLATTSRRDRITKMHPNIMQEFILIAHTQQTTTTFYTLLLKCRRSFNVMNSGSTLRAILWIVTLNWSQAFYLLIPKMRNTWITLIAFGMWSWWCEGMETMEITIDGIQNANPSASEAHTPSFNEASLISINSNGQANSSATFPSHPFGVELNSNKVNRQHPYVINIPGSRTTACAAIFRSLSSRVIDIWWEDGNGGLEQGSLYPGQESTTNSYQGHVFFFTAHNNKSDEIARVLINPSQVDIFNCIANS